MLSMTRSTAAHLYSEAAVRTQPSPFREICRLIDALGMGSLAAGWPGPQVFPDRRVSQLVETKVVAASHRVLQYGTLSGVRELREELTRRAAAGAAPELNLASLDCRRVRTPGSCSMRRWSTTSSSHPVVRSSGTAVARTPPRLSYARACEKDIEVAVARLGRLLRRRLSLIDEPSPLS